MTGPLLVTGAGGFAGSHLVDLLAGNDPVVGWVRSAAPAQVHTSAVMTTIK